jgi:hypothetical protein
VLVSHNTLFTIGPGEIRLFTLHMVQSTAGVTGSHNTVTTHWRPGVLNFSARVTDSSGWEDMSGLNRARDLTYVHYPTTIVGATQEGSENNTGEQNKFNRFRKTKTHRHSKVPCPPTGTFAVYTWPAGVGRYMFFQHS